MKFMIPFLIAMLLVDAKTEDEATGLTNSTSLWDDVPHPMR